MTKERLIVRELFPEVDLIADPTLRDAIVTIWERLWDMSLYERLYDAPVAWKTPYPTVKHAQGLVKLAISAMDVSRQVHGTTFDRDVVIAAALLMEAGQLVEFKPKDGGGIDFTEIGRAAPHGWYPAKLAADLGVPMAVVHIVIVHSPNSAKPPNTPEGWLLYWICQANICGFSQDNYFWNRKTHHYQGS